jgi:hypothetical protein
MPLRQALGQAERHRQHVLRYCRRIGTGIAGHDQPVRQRPEIEPVDTGRKQLDQPEARGLFERPGRDLLVQLPGEQRLGPAQGLRALGVV